MIAYQGAAIHDGTTLHTDKMLLVDDGVVTVVAAPPAGCDVAMLDGGIITAGLVDLQVNGGGGVMFNDDQSVTALRTIAAAHHALGTAHILPTLITDTPARTKAAITAVIHAIAQGVSGIAGIHLEGPHLSVARKGAHDPALIRPMTDDDLAVIIDAADRLPNVMVTIAPENVTNAQIARMADAGVIVSLGHTDASCATCHAAFDAGARCATHLFNAMSQLTSREPGLVGAVLERGDVYAGLIADGVHVDPATIRVALAAKPDPARIFLVSDAMATAGSDITEFQLNSRMIKRTDGRLTLADGTLAGADLSMWQAVATMSGPVRDSLQTAIARATSIPAALLTDPQGAGTLQSAVYICGDEPSAWLDATNGNWSSISRVTSAIS